MSWRTKRAGSVIRLVSTAAIAVLFISAAQGGSADDRSWTRTRKVAPGVRYTTIKDAGGPFRIYILSIALSKPSTLDTVLATDVLPGLETTSSMARRSAALAAINGSYAHASGRPIYAFARDGFLDQTPFIWGRNFAPHNAETTAYFGHPPLSAWATIDGVIHSIDVVNAGLPAYDDLALFTPAGSWEERPPQNACSARLYPAESPRLRADAGVEAIHTVDEVLCMGGRMPRRGGVVISAPVTGARASEVTALIPGQQVVLGWSPEWTGVKDMVGGNPTLIEGGAIQWDSVLGNTPFHKRNPRTGVGLKANGRVLLVAVDGRRPGFSVGMSLEEFARLFEELGAEWALNLDGGGSTTFVLEGKIKNRPSDGRERPVSSSIVLLPGADPGEVSPASPGDAVTGAESAAVWREVVEDSGSTGGLADYLRAEHGRAVRELLRR